MAATIVLTTLRRVRTCEPPTEAARRLCCQARIRSMPNQVRTTSSRSPRRHGRRSVATNLLAVGTRAMCTRVAADLQPFLTASTYPHRSSARVLLPPIWSSVGEGLGNCESSKRSRRRSAYPDSSDRLKDLRVRVRSAFANNAAAGFMNRIQPKSSPTAM